MSSFGSSPSLPLPSLYSLFGGRHTMTKEVLVFDVEGDEGHMLGIWMRLALDHHASDNERLVYLNKIRTRILANDCAYTHPHTKRGKNIKLVGDD